MLDQPLLEDRAQLGRRGPRGVEEQERGAARCPDRTRVVFHPELADQVLESRHELRSDVPDVGRHIVVLELSQRGQGGGDLMRLAAVGRGQQEDPLFVVTKATLLHEVAPAHER